VVEQSDVTTTLVVVVSILLMWEGLRWLSIQIYKRTRRWIRRRRLRLTETSSLEKILMAMAVDTHVVLRTADGMDNQWSWECMCEDKRKTGMNNTLRGAVIDMVIEAKEMQPKRSIFNRWEPK